MPHLRSEDEELLLKLPTNFQEAQAVKATLALYKENYSALVIALLICLYLFMQVQLASYLLDGIQNPSSSSSQLVSNGSRTVCHKFAFIQVLQTLDIMHPSSCSFQK